MAQLGDEASPAAQAGNEEESFRILYLRNYRWVFHFFLRRGFSREESEDLVQETFLRVYRGISSFRRQANFETWLLQISFNVYRNELRRLKATKRSAPETSLDDLKPAEGERKSPTLLYEAPSSLDDTLGWERKRLLANAIADLPPQMRRCVVLRVGQGLSYQETAAVMRVSVKTVHSHLFQASERLKLALGEHFANIEQDEPERDAR